MMKCQFCGKDYIKNKNKYFEILPERIKKNLEYIPTCNCLEENKKKGNGGIRKKKDP